MTTARLMREGGKLPEYVESGAVGEGWHPLLLALHERLTELDPGYLAGQVKEKFGGLRVYLDTPAPEGARAAIDLATAESTRTCEQCGAGGRRRARDGNPWTWIKTLCDEHAREMGYTD